MRRKHHQPRRRAAKVRPKAKKKQVANRVYNPLGRYLEATVKRWKRKKGKGRKKRVGEDKGGAGSPPLYASFSSFRNDPDRLYRAGTQARRKGRRSRGERGKHRPRKG